jgi:hypothetical protein
MNEKMSPSELLTRRTLIAAVVASPLLIQEASAQTPPTYSTQPVIVGDTPAGGPSGANIRIGYMNGPVTYTVSPVTGVAAYGATALGAQSMGGDAGFTWNGAYSVAVGYLAAGGSSGAYCLTAVGLRAAYANTANYVTALGCDTLLHHQTGSSFVAVGAKAGLYDVTGTVSVMIGTTAGYNAVCSIGNTFVGDSAGYSGVFDATHSGNTFIGNRAGYGLPIGSQNTFVGQDAGNVGGEVDYCTFVGLSAGAMTPAGVSLSTAIGFNAQVTGSGQLQLGDSNQAPYAFSALQVRSDVRDKADVRDTSFGLDFILSLRPREYRLDLRDDYAESAVPLSTDPEWENRRRSWWSRPIKDGSKKRARFHQGLIYQEVAQVAPEWAGLNDQALAGGLDVKSIGYGELYAPLIKAIQELHAIATAQAAEIADLKKRS